MNEGLKKLLEELGIDMNTNVSKIEISVFCSSKKSEKTPDRSCNMVKTELQ